MALDEKYDILIVDDKPHNLLAMEALLEGEDRNIVTASSGNDALGLMLVHDFALVLLDVQMPGMDGLETAWIMKKNKKTKHIPIIFVTAINKEQHHVFEGYNAGAVDYIFKPVEPVVLRAKINVLLQLHRQKKNIDQTNKLLQKMIYDLELANRKILYHHKTAIDGEKIKATLQLSTATVYEFNPPLTQMIKNINSLMTCTDNPELQPFILEDIKKSGEQISQTVKKLQAIHYRTIETENIPCAAILAVGKKDAGVTRLMQHLKTSGIFDISDAASVQEALSLISRKKMNIILIIDYILPDGTGFDIMDRLKQENLDIPVIFITDNGDEMIEAWAIKEGAYDYLSKTGLNGKTLMESLSNVLGKERLKKEIAALYDHLSVLSNRDAQTKLYNRRYFNETIEAQISKIKRYGSHMSVCMIDLDHFKNINDQLGPVAGDKILSKTAGILRDLVRECDIVCRYDGEAFGLILPETSPKNAFIVSERIRNRIAELQYDHDTETIGVTVSIGIASYDQKKNLSLSGLIDEADHALSFAKANGRNRVEIFNK